MSATDELRRLLDERGVEWQAYELNPFEKTTSWDIDASDPAHEVCASLDEFDSGTTLMRFWNCTPEQAIAATLVTPRTTHAIIVSDESTDCATGHCKCELCGQPIDPWDRFCRWCGARVVEPTTNGVGAEVDDG